MAEQATAGFSPPSAPWSTSSSRCAPRFPSTEALKARQEAQGPDSIQGARLSRSRVPHGGRRGPPGARGGGAELPWKQPQLRSRHSRAGTPAGVQAPHPKEGAVLVLSPSLHGRDLSGTRSPHTASEFAKGPWGHLLPGSFQRSRLPVHGLSGQACATRTRRSGEGRGRY